MRLGWLVSAGVCALFVACSASTHKRVLECDAAVCNPTDGGAAGTPAVIQPGDAGAGGANDAGTQPDASTDGGAPPDGGMLEPDGGDSGPPPPSSTLEVTLSGNGSVAVTNEDACLSGLCQYPLNDGTVLTLEAKPGPDSRFVGWSGACAGTSPTTTVTVSGLKQCVATFAIQRAVSVTVDVAGTGSVSTDPNLSCTSQGCAGQVDDNSHLTLHAAPAAGFRFVGWAGSAACDAQTQSALALVITADLSCTAKFSKQYTVSVSANGAAAAVSVQTGTCTAATCTADAGATATFTANPVTGYRFTGWTGAAQCTGVAPSLALVVTSDVACVANYVAQYRVTGLVGSGLAGTVTATSANVNSACSTNACIVDSGASTTLVAPTISGNRLTGWTGAGCPATGQGNGLTVTPTTGDITCTAIYALGVSVTGTVVGATGTVAAASTSPGNNCTPGACGIDSGGSVTLTAPNLLPTYRFINWTGDAGCAGAALTLTLTSVTSSKACNANYTQQFTIVAKANAGGTAGVSSGGNACAGGSCTVDTGTSVALSATPDTANGYHFVNWTGTNCAPATNNPLTLSNLNTTCTANFALNTFTIAAAAGTNGSVTATRGDTNAVCAGASCLVTFGVNVTLAATPAAHYHFVGWTGASCTPTTNNPIVVTNVNTTCNAAFAVDTFTATAAVTPTAAGSATISCTPSACTAVPYGTLVNIGLTTNPGWALVGWSAGCATGGVTITANTACLATFRPVVTGTGTPASLGSVVVSATPNATCVAGNPATCAVDSGGSATLSAKPAVDSVFTSWSGDCSGNTSPVTLSNVTAPQTCTASYYGLWAQATGAAGNEDMTEVVGLADGSVVGIGDSFVVGARSGHLAIVNLDANTGKVGRNQIFADASAAAYFSPVGLALTANQKSVIALGVHRTVAAATIYPWLHNEQAPAWEYEYKYAEGDTVSANGNVITTLDGGYAFCVSGYDAKNGNGAHLTKVDANGKPIFDVLFHGVDVNGAILPTAPVDVVEQPNGKYFAVLSEVTGALNEVMITYVGEDGTLLGSDQFQDGISNLAPERFVFNGTDTFLIAGTRTGQKSGDADGFYVQWARGGGKPVFAFDVGSTAEPQSIASLTRTAKGFALAGQYTDANFGTEAWLVQIDAAGAVTSQFGYGGSGAGNEVAYAVVPMPLGGFALAGSTTSWGAGLADMWTLRLDANANITFNGASAAHRTATAFARTAITTLGSITITLQGQPVVATQVAPVENITTPGFAQNAQAP